MQCGEGKIRLIKECCKAHCIYIGHIHRTSLEDCIVRLNFTFNEYLHPQPGAASNISMQLVNCDCHSDEVENSITSSTGTLAEHKHTSTLTEHKH